MQDKINQLECELDNVKNSKSLKLGVALTAIPRKLKSRVKRQFIWGLSYNNLSAMFNADFIVSCMS